MKILKYIIVGLGGLIALLLIIAIFVPKDYTVSVSQTVDKPKQVVLDYVKILKNQEQYSEWVKADPNNHPEIVGTDGTVGAVQKWNSKDDNVGEGQQTITTLTDDSMLVELKFIRPFKGEAKAANLFKALSDNQTQITSVFYGHADYPFNLMAVCMGKKMIKDTQAKNLNNIKQILEKK